MTKKATAIVGYLGIIGFIIAYCAGDKEAAKFDLNQGLVLAIAEIVCAVVGQIPYIGFLFSLVSLACFVLSIIGIINACNEVEKPLPVVGDIQVLK